MSLLGKTMGAPENPGPGHVSLWEDFFPTDVQVVSIFAYPKTEYRVGPPTKVERNPTLGEDLVQCRQLRRLSIVDAGIQDVPNTLHVLPEVLYYVLSVFLVSVGVFVFSDIYYIYCTITC